MLKILLLMLLTISTAYAGEKQVLERLKKNYPHLGQVDQVNKSPIPGLYEVVTPDHLFYTDEKTNYLIDGNIYDLHTMHNLTEERARKLYAVDFNSLPFDLALKEVKGNGQRKMVVFTDPNCGFCKKLEHELQSVNNVTVYRLLFPIFEGSEEKVRNVWCSADRNKTWEDLMLRGIAPPAVAKCDAPIAQVMAWGRKLKVNGTPALIFSDGILVPGALPAEDLEKALNGESVR